MAKQRYGDPADGRRTALARPTISERRPTRRDRRDRTLSAALTTVVRPPPDDASLTPCSLAVQTPDLVITLVAEVVLSREVEQHVEVLVLDGVDGVLHSTVVVTDRDVVEHRALAVEDSLD